MSETVRPEKFTVAHEGDVWVATHVGTGVASQGADPTEAVAMAEEAVELSQQEHEPASSAEQERFRRELGIEFDGDEQVIESPNGMP
jgi:predicted RNase H-like HicB family nuclease